MKKLKKIKKISKKLVPKKRIIKKRGILAPKKVLGRKPSKRKIVRQKPRKQKTLSVQKVLPPSEEILKNFLDKAAMRGFITENELLFAFPEVESYLKKYEGFLDELESRGIQVVEIGENFFGRKKEHKEILKQLGIAEEKKQIDLTELSADSIQMYLR